MIDRVIIGGQEYRVSPTYGHFNKIAKMFPDMDQMAKWGLVKYNKFIFDSLWVVLVPKFWLIKPFVFKSRMKKAMLMPEMRYFQRHIHEILTGEEDEKEEAKGSPGKSQKTRPTI
jgi:hypothetical protein